MLRPDEFTVGSLTDASGLSLMLPHGAHEQPFLITHANPHPIAIFLDGQNQFQFFGYDEDHPWTGLLIPNVNIEVDENSAFNAVEETSPAGAIVRAITSLYIAARGGPSAFRAERVAILTGLPACGQNIRAGFRKWQITVGSGVDKRILKTFDLSPPAAG